MHKQVDVCPGDSQYPRHLCGGVGVRCHPPDLFLYLSVAHIAPRLPFFRHKKTRLRTSPLLSARDVGEAGSDFSNAARTLYCSAYSVGNFDVMDTIRPVDVVVKNIRQSGVWYGECMGVRRSSVRISIERKAKARRFVESAEPQFSPEHQEALAVCLARLRPQEYDDYLRMNTRWGQVPPEVTSIQRPSIWPVAFAAALARRVIRWENRVGIYHLHHLNSPGGSEDDAEADFAFDTVEMLKLLRIWKFSKQEVDNWFAEYQRALESTKAPPGRPRITGPYPKGWDDPDGPDEYP